MKALLFLLFALMNYTGLFAQNRTTITVKAGSKISDVFTPTELFYYPQFTKGKVYFKDGTTSSAKLNYSLLVDEIQFIGPKGDTLSLADQQTIGVICIEADSFYYDKGYLRFVAGNRLVKLVEKKIWQVAETQRMGAFNTPTSTASINSQAFYNVNGTTYNLVLNEELTLRKVELHFFMDRNSRVVPAGKKNLLKLFPKEQRRIETFLKDNQIDFTNKNDLEKIVQFLGLL